MLFIAKAAPWAAGEVMTLSPHDTGTCKPVHALTVKFRQLSHEFTFGVDMTFVSYPLVLTPVV
jgi:hypothetical protein